MNLRVFFQNFGIWSTLELVEKFLGAEPHFWVLCFFWLTVWVNRINKCGWCLTEGRACRLKGPQEVASLSSVFHHAVRLSQLYQEFYVHCVVIINDGGMV